MERNEEENGTTVNSENHFREMKQGFISIRELSKGLNSIILIDKIRTFLINVARYSTTQLRWHGSNGIISLFFRGIDELSIEVFHIADSEEPGCARSPLEIYRIATLTTSHWEAYTTVSHIWVGFVQTQSKTF